VGDAVEQSGSTSLGVQVVATGLTALLGFGLGGPIGAAVGAAAAPLAAEFIQRMLAEWQRKASVVAETALSWSGMQDDPEGFVRSLSDDPRLTALAQRIAFAANVTGNDQKLRALGQILGGAIKARGDRLDEAEVLTSVFTDIGSAEVLALEVLAGDPQNAEQQRQAAKVTDQPHPAPLWTVEEVQDALPMDPGFAQACLSVLARYGLAEAVNTYGQIQPYRITEFGRGFLNVVQAAAEGPGSAPAADN
jgi:hypothetical protein